MFVLRGFCCPPKLGRRVRYYLSRAVCLDSDWSLRVEKDFLFDSALLPDEI